MNPLPAQLRQSATPDVAAAIRSEEDEITPECDAAVRQSMPQVKDLTIDELRESTPPILRVIADALASDDHAGVFCFRGLIGRISLAKKHALSVLWRKSDESTPMGETSGFFIQK